MRSWTVLLVGGSSGIGKTSLVNKLAEIYDTKVIEADDICRSIFSMTDESQYQAIHYWYGDSDWSNNTTETNVEYLLSVSRELNPALKSIVYAHLRSDTPIIIEGDFISPDLALSFDDDRVRSVFIHEPDRKQIIRNYMNREGGNPQDFRAGISHLFGENLKSSCEVHNLLILNARPWVSLVDRIKKLIN